MTTKLKSLLLRLAFMVLTGCVTFPTMAADKMDLFEQYGIQVPNNAVTASQQSPAPPVPASVTPKPQAGAFAELWEAEDAACAYGDTAIKVTLVFALLTIIQFVRRAIGKKSESSGSTIPKLENDLSAISYAQAGYIINWQQKFILASTAIVMIVMIMFPPFHIMREGHEVMAAGHHFGLQFQNASVDRAMLCIQLVVTFLAGMIGALLFYKGIADRPYS